MDARGCRNQLGQRLSECYLSAFGCLLLLKKQSFCLARFGSGRRTNRHAAMTG